MSARPARSSSCYHRRLQRPRANGPSWKSIAECEYGVAHRIEAGRPDGDPCSRFHASIELGPRVAFLHYSLGTKSAARRGAVMIGFGDNAVRAVRLGSCGGWPAPGESRRGARGEPARPEGDGADESSLGRHCRARASRSPRRSRIGGSAEAPASTTTFSLSKDKKTATKDLKGVQLVPALPATDRLCLGGDRCRRPGTPAGVYYLQACADGPAKISEASESNNCKWSAEQITVLPLPDLVVTAITDPRRGAARTELQGQEHREERRHGAFGGDHHEVLPGVNLQRGAGGSGRRAIRSGPQPGPDVHRRGDGDRSGAIRRWANIGCRPAPTRGRRSPRTTRRTTACSRPGRSW